MTVSAVRQPRFYGLLYVTEKDSHPNLRSKNPIDIILVRNRIDIYLSCAALTAASIRAFGGNFALITNAAYFLRDRCKALGIDLEIIDHVFKRSVPTGIRFYSAHFKLDIIEAFSTGRFGEPLALVDVDTVFLKPLILPASLGNHIIAYDITNIDVEPYEMQRVHAELELVAGQPLRDARWYGGEFLMGNASTFKVLSEKIQQCWPNYVEALGSLRHVGDETVVSAAINLAVETGLPLANADSVGGVARWWTSRTRVPMPSFKEIEDRSLLHLPADKIFLASYPRCSFNGPRFVATYRKYAARKLLVRSVVTSLSKFFGDDSRFVARLD
jgi:hypothetical protein